MADHETGSRADVARVRVGTVRPGPISIVPQLSVRHGKEAVEFYTRAFGASETHRVEDPAGEIVARLTLGATEFWVADESPENENPSPVTLNGSPVRMILTVPDPDAVFQRAVDNGCRVVYPVADQPYGWRVGRLVDPFGHHWEIGRPLDPPT